MIQSYSAIALGRIAQRHLGVDSTWESELFLGSKVFYCFSSNRPLEMLNTYASSQQPIRRLRSSSIITQCPLICFIVTSKFTKLKEASPLTSVVYLINNMIRMKSESANNHDVMNVTLKISKSFLKQGSFHRGIPRHDFQDERRQALRTPCRNSCLYR